jgi:SNF2 family DNA or RNA helicase
MQVKFNQPKTRIMFITEGGVEYKNLMSFPAFIKEGPYFYVPAKWAVASNVLKRVSLKYKNIKVDKDVYDFCMSQPTLKPLPASFKFHTTPMDFQEIALRYMYTVGSAGLLLDPGMGKSKVVLDYIWLMQFKKVIIICPKPLLFVWEDEIRIHRPELTYHTVKTTNWSEEKDGILVNQVTIMNYNKAVAFRVQLQDIGYEFIHLDEFLIKDPSTARTQEITALSKGIPYRAGGSGTLVNNSILDVFCPVRFIEPALVGWNYTNFLRAHTVLAKVKPGAEASVRAIVAFKGMDIARSILESCSIVMTKEQWLKNMPEKKFHDIYVNPSAEQKAVYDSLLRNYIAEFKGEFIEIDNALVMLSKLYQISNGFIYKTDKPEVDIKERDAFAANDLDDLIQDDGKKKKPKRKTLFFDQQPKIDAMRKLLTETIPGRRTIIWFNMGAEKELICNLLDELGKQYLTISGGENNVGGKVREFNTNPNYEYLVCQAKSVNYGITVLGTTMEKLEDSEFEMFPGITPEVHTQIFYSINFSLEVYLQQQDRIHRLGQKHQCDYYRLFTNTTIEHQIREAITEKMTIRKDMLVDIAEKIQKSAIDLV